MSIQSEINRINNTVDGQSDLIEEIKNAVNNLPEAGGGEFTEEDLQAKYNEGLADGEEKVKTEEARTDEAIDCGVDEDGVSLLVPSGYYSEMVEIVFSVESGALFPITDKVYREGYQEGLGAGSDVLEALGALCDWSIMTDTSSIPTVCLVNYHPTYYMHCSMFGDNDEMPFYLTEEGEAVYPEEGYVVVAPNSVLDLTFDHPMASIGTIYVENMRWSKYDTI